MLSTFVDLSLISLCYLPSTVCFHRFFILVCTLSSIKNSIFRQYSAVWGGGEGAKTYRADHGGINNIERPRGGEFDLLRVWGSFVNITSSRRTVRLGSLQGVYERFPIKK